MYVRLYKKYFFAHLFSICREQDYKEPVEPPATYLSIFSLISSHTCILSHLHLEAASPSLLLAYLPLLPHKLRIDYRAGWRNHGDQFKKKKEFHRCIIIFWGEPGSSTTVIYGVMNPHLGMTEQSIRIQSSQQLQGENTDLLVVWPLQVVLLFLLFSQHIVLKYFVWFNLYLTCVKLKIEST